MHLGAAAGHYVPGVELLDACGPKIPVPTFDGLNGEPAGIFYIDGYTYLPVLSVSYLDDQTEVICLSPEGSFCRITTKDFDFEI